jgi:DnaJ-class molecular chaperone
MSKRTAYGILGVLRMAPLEEIRDCYYRLAVLHHPDHGGDVETMMLISKAWAAIKTPEKRKAYEQKLIMMSVTCKKCLGRGGVAIHKNFQRSLRRCEVCDGEGVESVTGETI